MAFPLLGALISGGMGLLASNRAASAQRRAADQNIGFQRETRDQIMGRMEPFYQGGIQGQNALMYEMGMGQRPEGYSGFQASPGFQYALGQANDAVEGSAAARGGLFSSSTLNQLQGNALGLAQQDYGNWMSRLSGLAGSGQNAAAGQATAMTNAAAQIGNSFADRGNTAAAGWIGAGNTVADTIDNATGIWQYQNHLNGGQGFGQGGFFGNMFGGGNAGGSGYTGVRPQARPVA